MNTTQYRIMVVIVLYRLLIFILDLTLRFVRVFFIACLDFIDGLAQIDQ